MSYTTEEYTYMIYFYGMARGNARAAERLYAEQFPNRRHPLSGTITACFRRAIETGVLAVHQHRDRAVRRHVNDDERILRAFEENPQISVRRVSRALAMPQTTVYRVLRENRLHPYHFQRVQQLLTRDEIQRIYFCEGILTVYSTFSLIFTQF